MTRYRNVHEAASTQGPAFDANHEAVKPIPPPGEGWALVSAVTMPNGIVIWYWDRTVSVPAD